MDFAFRRKSARPGADLRQTALDRLSASLALCKDGDDPATVHELRKNIKRLRAIMALCRPGRDPARRIDRTLRDAGRRLAPLREGDALVALFDSLVSDPADPALASARAALHANATSDDPASRAAAVARHATVLTAIRADLKAWKIPLEDFDTLESRLRATHRKARKLMRAALADPRGETLHDWRKRVKAHGYHVQLLRPIDPARMADRITGLDRLGDLLGEARDCAILAERLDAASLAPDIAARARTRETAVLAEAAPTARRIFAPGFPSLARRWRKWWRAWKARGG